MSYKVLMLGGRDTQFRIAVSGPWNSPPPADLQDAQLLRSWLVYDSELEGQEPRVRWNTVWGLTVAFGISAAFWTGVGLLIAHFVS